MKNEYPELETTNLDEDGQLPTGALGQTVRHLGHNEKKEKRFAEQQKAKEAERLKIMSKATKNLRKQADDYQVNLANSISPHFMHLMQKYQVQPAPMPMQNFADGGQVPLQYNPIDFDKLQANLPQATGNQGLVREIILQQLKDQQNARQQQFNELEQRRLAPQSKWDEASSLFKMANAFAQPSKYGGFGATLSNFATGVGGYADDQSKFEKSRRDIRDQQLELLTKGADIRTLGELGKMGAPESNYGKQAMDEGFVVGTPEFAKRVKQLHNEHQAYLNQKTGGGTGANRKFDAQEKKDLRALDTDIRTLESSAKRFEEMEQLSGGALSGNFAGAQRFLYRNLPTGLDKLSGTNKEQVEKTAKLDNLVRQQVAQTLKATFGGSQITEGERRYLEDMGAKTSYSKDERDAIIEMLKRVNAQALEDKKAHRASIIEGDVYRQASGGQVPSFAEGGDVKKKDKPSYSDTEARIAKLLAGATFGFGDEAVGQLGRAKDWISGKDQATRDANYERRVAQQRAMLKDYEERNPIESTALEVLGGLGTGGVFSGGAKLGAKLLPKVAEKASSAVSAITPKMLENSPKLAKLLNLSAQGAGYGGLAGYGTSENPDQTVGDTVSGAVQGAVANPLLAKAISTVPAVGRAIKRQLFEQGNVAQNRGTDRVLKALGQNDLTPDDLRNVAKNYERLGIDDAVLADLNPTMTNLADVVAMKANPKQQALNQMYENRIRGERDMAGKRLDVLSGGKSAYDEAENIIHRMKHSPQPLYEQTFSQFPHIQNEDLNHLLRSPAFKGAIKEAENIGELTRSNIQAQMREDLKKATTKAEREAIVANAKELMEHTKTPSFLMKGAGVDEYADNPQILDAILRSEKVPTRFLDLVKKGVDAQIEKGTKGATLSKTEARELLDAKNKMLTMADEATKLKTPQTIGEHDLPVGTSLYGKARGTYADEAQLREALEAGKQMFSSRKHRGEEVQKYFEKLTPEQKEMFRLGASDSLHNAFETGSRNINASKLIADDPSIHKKLRPLFESEKAYNDFIEGFQKRSDLMRNAQTVARGSQTAKRLLGDQEFNDTLRSDDAILSALGTGAQILTNPTGIYHFKDPLVRYGKIGLEKVRNPMRERQAEEVSDLLMQPLTTEGVEALIPRLQRREAGLAKRQAQREADYLGSLAGVSSAFTRPEEKHALGGLVNEAPPLQMTNDVLQNRALNMELARQNQIQMANKGIPLAPPKFQKGGQVKKDKHAYHAKMRAIVMKACGGRV